MGKQVAERRVYLTKPAIESRIAQLRKELCTFEDDYVQTQKKMKALADYLADLEFLAKQEKA